MEVKPSPNPESVSVAPPSPPRSQSWLLFGLVILLLLSLGSMGFLFYQNAQLKKQIVLLQVTPTPAVSPSPTTSPTADWQTFIIKTIGLELKIPPELSNIGELKEELLSSQRKGYTLCVTFPKKTSLLVKSVSAGGAFCDINTFGLGTTSIDFDEGRMAGFSDLQGFEIVQGKYYARLNISVDKKIELPNELVSEITSSNGVKILKIIGKNSIEGEWQGPISGTPGEGWIGALINTDNSTYPGISVQMKLEGSLTPNLFEQILSTIKLVDGSITSKDHLSNEKVAISEAVGNYLEALINGNRGVAFSYLTEGVKKDVPENWPSYQQYKTYEVLNEFHSIEEENQFYSQDRITLNIKLYAENDQIGSKASLLFLKENGVWKTLTWYLFP